MGESEDSAPGGKALGTIPLRQVRVSRADLEDRVAANPMNRLVPYLDLFSRLSDAELARLGVVGPEIVAQLRKQVVQVDRALRRYIDLLPRLRDDELVRLTGASNKTIRFWRLCQGREAAAPAPTESDAVARAVRSRAETAPHPIITADDSPQPQQRRLAAPGLGTSRPQPPTPAFGSPAFGHTASPVTPAFGSAAIADGSRRPTPAPGELSPTSSTPGSQPAIEITGSPFPGYDYDPDEPISDELSVDLPDPLM